MARNWTQRRDGSLVLHEGPYELGDVIAEIEPARRSGLGGDRRGFRWRLVQDADDYNRPDLALWCYVESVSQAMEQVSDAIDAEQLEAYAARGANPLALVATALGPDRRRSRPATTVGGQHPPTLPRRAGPDATDRSPRRGD